MGRYVLSSFQGLLPRAAKYLGLKATRMERVHARAPVMRLCNRQISKRLTLVAVSNDGFYIALQTVLVIKKLRVQK